MNIIKIISLSLGSLVILFLLTKLMGNREISQLTMFDYIVGITIGSIAAEMSTSLENNFIEPVVAMLIYGIVSFSISFFTCKSLNMRRFFTGKAKILLDNGKLYRKNFKSAKLDINEFLMECRINGYFNLSDIQTAILEPNGRISFLPKALKILVKQFPVKILHVNPINIMMKKWFIPDKFFKSHKNKMMGYITLLFT